MTLLRRVRVALALCGAWLALAAPAQAGGPMPPVAGPDEISASALTWLEIAPEVRVLRPWLREAAQRHGVDEALLKAVIAVESGFDAAAVSPRGAVGLMQIMPATGDHYATPQERRLPAAERLRDPRTNILTGARVLADLLGRYGRVDVALAAWNAGEGAVRRHGNRMPPFAETRAHVQRVLALYTSLQQREPGRASASP